MASTRSFVFVVFALCFAGVLQVCHGTDSKYGRSCKHDVDCMSDTDDSAKCVKKPLEGCYHREFDYDTTKSVSACPFTINTTRDVPQPACVGVPEAVQNVQVDVSRTQDNKVTVNITWSPPTKYVGPLVYEVYLLGDDQEPTDPIYWHHGMKDEDTFYQEFENVAGNLNYSINVTAVSAAGYSSDHAPVRITNTKPFFSSSDKLVSPSDDVATSFDMKLCSSCLLDPNQGAVETIAIIVCDTRKSSKCQSSYVHADDGPSTIKITQAEDMKLFPTWASAKSSNFDTPYRATPDDFHQMLRQEGSAETIYTVGGSYCSEYDVETFCNGPVLQGSEFTVTVIACNNIGCDEWHSKSGQFTSEPDDDDDSDGIIIGLAVTLSIALILCIVMAVYIVWDKRYRPFV